MIHRFVYRNDLGAEVTINIEWPDSFNTTPPPEIVFGDPDSEDVRYTYNRTLL